MTLPKSQNTNILPLPQELNITFVAKLIGVHPSTIRRYIAGGYLKTDGRGTDKRTVLIARESLSDYLSERFHK